MDKFQGMNQFLKEKLRAPTMTAHDSPDGGDTELQDAATAVADMASDFPVTPAFPVPLMHPLERGPGMRGAASEVWLVNPPAALPGLGLLVAGGNAEKGSQFPVNSIRVDNYTSQWMYWPENGVFVPPFWTGKVFRYTGSLVQRVRFETPTGLTALATAATEIARVLFSEDYWDEQSGGSMIGNVGAGGGAGAAGVAIVDESTGIFAEVLATADAIADPQDGLAADSFNFGFNGVSWDRLRSQGSSLDAIATATLGFLKAAGFQYGFNGNTWDRLRVPNVFKQMANVAIGAGSTATVWTPAAGKKPRLMGWVVTATSGLADGSVAFFETNTSGTFMGEVGFLAGVETPAYSSYGQGGPIVSTSSAVIVAFSSTAMTIRGTLFGTEE